MGKLEQKLNQINERIFIQSDRKYDIRNLNGYLETSQNLSGLDDVISSAHVHFKDFVPDETREIYKDLLELYKEGAGREKVKKLLTRDILFYGSECKEQGEINILNEFETLKNIIDNEYLKLFKAENQTKDGLIDTWYKTQPEIIIISCHGSEYGLFLKNKEGKCKEYNNTDFYNFFKRRSNYTECVILSSCLSKNLGEFIAEYGRNVICINKKVRIDQASKYIFEFFRYLNMFSLDNSEVYENAHDYSLEKLEFESSPDSFSFEFIKANKINL